jgi:transcriptional regulator with XRE-family HTH domain
MNAVAVLGEADTLAGQMRRKRVSMGMSQHGLAAELGVNSVARTRWARVLQVPRLSTRQSRPIAA